MYFGRNLHISKNCKIALKTASPIYFRKTQVTPMNFSNFFLAIVLILLHFCRTSRTPKENDNSNNAHDSNREGKVPCRELPKV